MPIYDAQGNEIPGLPDVPVVQGGGEVAMVGPDGWRGTIPAANVAKALEMGFKPEAPAEHKQRALEAQFDSPIKAGLEGLARGATLGLSDVVLAPYTTDYTAPEAERVSGVAMRKALNPTAAGIGEVGGFLATSALTGLGGAAGALGDAAVGGGTGILARAGSAAVRGLTEGSAMGLGQGISDVALSKDPMSAEAIAGSVGHHILVGGTIGAAGGAALSLAGSALGATLSVAGKAVQRSASKLHAELADDTAGALTDVEPALRSEVMGMSAPQVQAATKAETATLEAARAEQGKAIVSDLGDFYTSNRNQLFQLRNQLPDKALTRDAIKAIAKVKAVLQDPRGLAEAPVDALKPVRILDSSLDTMSKYLPADTLAPMRQQLADIEQRIVSVSGKVSSPRLDALEEWGTALSAPAKKTPMIDAMAKTAGASIGGVIGHAIPVPGAAYAGAWLGAEISETLKPVLKRVLGSFAGASTTIEDGAGKLMAKLTPPAPAMDALKTLATASTVTGADDYERATKAIQMAAADPAASREHITQQLAGLSAVAPQTAQATTDQLLKTQQFLASKIPPLVTMGLTGQAIPPSEYEQATWARYVAAAQDPLRIMKELRSGTLMPETVETHQALYPSMLGKLTEALTTQLADPTVASKVPYSMRLQLGMLLGPGVEPTLAPDFISTMQATYAAKPTSKAPTTSEKPTEAQRLATR